MGKCSKSGTFLKRGDVGLRVFLSNSARLLLNLIALRFGFRQNCLPQEIIEGKGKCCGKAVLAEVES